MTSTPERYLHAARLKNHAKGATFRTATCPVCGRAFDPFRKAIACSTTCAERVRQREVRPC